ncbi:MAG TPA: hypothetical protein PLI09_22990 [Candidatus Hydrogenedentes bacterium]|nr:hypothetical protein [Candidatus Hydrogenedentota bacterium]
MNMMAEEELFKKYVLVHGPQKGESANVLKGVFEQYFSPKFYALPLVISSFLVFWLAVMVLARLQQPVLACIFPDPFSKLLALVPKPILAACIGGYLWGLFDVLSRFRAHDLTPESIHFLWLRMLIAGAFAYVLAPTFQPAVATFLGFAMGFFPITTIKNLIVSRALKQLDSSSAAIPSEAPTLHKIQGLTEAAITRLSEENIESVQHLAYADPIKLLFRTNFEWKFILDIIDQAVLYIYIEDKIESLRKLGIRGAIEMATLIVELDEVVPVTATGDKRDPANTISHKKDLANATIDAIAQKLEIGTCVVERLCRAMSEDFQVEFIWNLLPDDVKNINNPAGEAKAV